MSTKVADIRSKSPHQYSSRPGDGNSGLLTVVQNVSEARNVSVPGDGNLGEKHVYCISTNHISVDRFLAVNYYNVNNSNQCKILFHGMPL